MLADRYPAQLSAARNSVKRLHALAVETTEFCTLIEPFGTLDAQVRKSCVAGCVNCDEELRKFHQRVS